MFQVTYRNEQTGRTEKFEAFTKSGVLEGLRYARMKGQISKGKISVVKYKAIQEYIIHPEDTLPWDDLALE